MTTAELLENSVRDNGGRTALIFAERKWTYRDLLQSVKRAAKGFQASGIKAGDRVVLLSKNSPEFVITNFALGHLGAIAVPVNFYLKPEEIAFICLDSGATAMVTQSSFVETVRSVRTQYPALKDVWITDSAGASGDPATKSFSSLLANDPIASVPVSGNEATCIILYTSGTTGKPKGVMLSHRNLTLNAKSSIKALGISGGDRFICILPMFHVFAWTTNVLVPLSLGCLVVAVDGIRPPRPWLKLMGKHGITIFAAVPQIFAVLADQATGLKRLFLKYYFFRKARFCISGAAPLQSETLLKFEKAIGAPLLEGYGLTETSPVVSSNTLEHKKAGSVGRPIPGVEVRIIDRDEKELPPDEEGEICIRGHCIMQGYRGQPEATKLAFTKDGWFKTGDIGILDREGFLHIRDRIKDMIIVKGLKVFSVQIEDILLSHPAVAEAAVVGVPDASGDETIRGFVVFKDGASVDKSELMKLCQDRLPPYKRPRDIEIRKELPKNALQKILKRELRNQSK